MVTDLPRWVIQTAERWGIYWGGYGWSSGCQDTTTERTSVYRDPPHFEFRGTPEQARAIVDFNLGNDPSRICIPIVDDEGNDTEHCGRSSKPAATSPGARRAMSACCAAMCASAPRPRPRWPG